MRGRHARFYHSLESNSLVLIADKGLRFDGEKVNPSDRRAFCKPRTSFALGSFEYELEFTNLDGDIYRAQLEQLAKELEYKGQRPPSFLDPTPRDTDYKLDEYTIRPSFAKGSSCCVCPAIDKAGAIFAVKKIIANTKEACLEIREEAEGTKINKIGCPVSLSFTNPNLSSSPRFV
jgi:hypothetical protein